MRSDIINEDVDQAASVRAWAAEKKEKLGEVKTSVGG